MGSLAGKRRDTFGLALNELRVRVRDGRAAPGTPLMVSDLAEELKLSPTPVREALAWLAGEGRRWLGLTPAPFLCGSAS